MTVADPTLPAAIIPRSFSSISAWKLGDVDFQCRQIRFRSPQGLPAMCLGPCVVLLLELGDDRAYPFWCGGLRPEIIELRLSALRCGSEDRSRSPCRARMLTARWEIGWRNSSTFARFASRSRTSVTDSFHALEPASRSGQRPHRTSSRHRDLILLGERPDVGSVVVHRMEGHSTPLLVASIIEERWAPWKLRMISSVPYLPSRVELLFDIDAEIEHRISDTGLHISGSHSQCQRAPHVASDIRCSPSQASRS